jgi:hypothetical protein
MVVHQVWFIPQGTPLILYWSDCLADQASVGAGAQIEERAPFDSLWNCLHEAASSVIHV